MNSQLRQMLRPAGGGVFTVSTGSAEQRDLQRQIYRTDDDRKIQSQWLRALEKIDTAELIIDEFGHKVLSFGQKITDAQITEKKHSLIRKEKLNTINFSVLFFLILTRKFFLTNFQTKMTKM